MPNTYLTNLKIYREFWNMNIYFYYTSDKSTGALGAPGAQNHEYEYEHFLYIWKSEIWIFTFKKHLEEAPESREPREPWEPREPREPQDHELY